MIFPRLKEQRDGFIQNMTTGETTLLYHPFPKCPPMLLQAVMEAVGVTVVVLTKVAVMVLVCHVQAVLIVNAVFVTGERVSNAVA